MDALVGVWLLVFTLATIELLYVFISQHRLTRLQQEVSPEIAVSEALKIVEPWLTDEDREWLIEHGATWLKPKPVEPAPPPVSAPVTAAALDKIEQDIVRSVAALPAAQCVPQGHQIPFSHYTTDISQIRKQAATTEVARTFSAELIMKMSLAEYERYRMYLLRMVRDK